MFIRFFFEELSVFVEVYVFTRVFGEAEEISKTSSEFLEHSFIRHKFLIKVIVLNVDFLDA